MSIKLGYRLTVVILALWEAKEGRPLEVRSSKSACQNGETLPLQKIPKKLAEMVLGTCSPRYSRG